MVKKWRKLEKRFIDQAFSNWQTFSFMGKNDVGGSPKKSRELTEEEVRKVREARIQQQQSDPNYLKGGMTSSSSLIKNSNITTADVDSIPIRQLSDVIPGGASGVPSLLIPGLASADQYFDPGYVIINWDHYKGQIKLFNQIWLIEVLGYI